jgi:hypothetical protein
MNLHMRLYLRPNGFWYVEFHRNRPISLKTRDKGQAQKLYRRLKEDYLAQRLAVLKGRPPAKTVGDFIIEYLAHREKICSPFTVQTDRLALRRLQESLGPDLQLTRISFQNLERWRDDLTRSVKKTSANTWFRHVKAALGKAKEWGLLEGDYILDKPI